MNVLIAFATKYGGTRVCAEKLLAALPGSGEVFELTDSSDVNPAAFDMVVLGTSIYLGRPRQAMRAYCKKHRDVLMTKKLGLFLCCMQDLEKPTEEQLSIAYPADLLAHASAKGPLGGVVDYEKLGRMERFIMNKVAGDLYKKTGRGPVSTITDEKIQRFAALLTENQ